MAGRWLLLLRLREHVLPRFFCSNRSVGKNDNKKRATYRDPLLSEPCASSAFPSPSPLCFLAKRFLANRSNASDMARLRPLLDFGGEVVVVLDFDLVRAMVDDGGRRRRVRNV